MRLLLVLATLVIMLVPWPVLADAPRYADWTELPKVRARPEPPLYPKLDATPDLSAIPAGTKITAVGAFDNSTQNKANPDPARKVPWGQQSWDEMFFGAVTYKFVDQSGAKLSSTAN